MKYPLTLSFKKIALAPQISVLGPDGNLIFYVKQKLFKLKEAITVFADQEQTKPLYTIGADRIIDFSAQYRFRNQEGIELGSVKRQGARSLWKAHYDIYDGDHVFMTIQEENAFVKVMDAIFGELPIIGIFSGYVFNPVYLVTQGDQVVMRVTKNPAFLESSFTIEEVTDIPESQEIQIILSLILMVLLERSRG